MSADPPTARRRLLGTLARATAVTVFLGLAVGVVGYDSWRGAPTTRTQPPKRPGRLVTQPALDSFGSCDDLLRYYRDNAASRVGPDGIGGTLSGGGPAYAVRGMAVPSAAQDAGATASTGTNVQVAGVDEADLMKLADGHLVSLTDGVLRISALGGGTARVLGTLAPKGWTPQQLLLAGSRALLIGNPVPVIRGTVMNDLAVRQNWMPTVRLAEADLSDPAHPRLVRLLDLPGSLVGARLTGGHVQLALSTNAGRLAWVYPDGKRTEAGATAANRRLVARSGLKDWLPRATLRDTLSDGTPTGAATTRDLLDCRQVSAPQRYAGLDTLSLLSLDLAAGGLGNWTGAGLVASGATVYATATHTYVATTPWAALAADSKPLPGGATMTEGEFTRTQIHLFDTTDNVLQYVASGQVDGALLGQFAMDEYQGRLRVASTLQPLAFPRPSAAKIPPTSGKVTVLQQDGRTLRTVGALGGLGRTESVQGVRFAGPVGYLVTFRQTDPLFTLDLADARHPKLSGELKLLGYSAYLHPAGDGLLLGLGQDADARGRSRGLQLSLFDVADPAAPRRLSQVRLPGAWSDAEFDHHAFSFADGLVLTPFARDGGFAADPQGKTGTHDAGVLAVRLQGRSLRPPMLLRPVADGPTTLNYSKPTQAGDLVMRAAPLRTTVLDGTVYTLTAAGIAAHDAGTGHRLGFTRF